MLILGKIGEMVTCIQPKEKRNSMFSAPQISQVNLYIGIRKTNINAEKNDPTKFLVFQHISTRQLYSYTDEIIILLNFIFTGLHGYEITPALSANKQRHRLLLLKTGLHVAPTPLQVMLSFGNILRD